MRIPHPGKLILCQKRSKHPSYKGWFLMKWKGKTTLTWGFWGPQRICDAFMEPFKLVFHVVSDIDLKDMPCTWEFTLTHVHDVTLDSFLNCINLECLVMWSERMWRELLKKDKLFQWSKSHDSALQLVIDMIWRSNPYVLRNRSKEADDTSGEHVAQGARNRTAPRGLLPSPLRAWLLQNKSMWT